MNTPTRMQRSSACDLEMTPSLTESTTARATERSGLRPDHQVDVSDFVTVADQRFTDEEFRGHTCLHSGFTSEEREDLAKHSAARRGESYPTGATWRVSHAVPRE